MWASDISEACNFVREQFGFYVTIEKIESGIIYLSNGDNISISKILAKTASTSASNKTCKSKTNI